MRLRKIICLVLLMLLLSSLPIQSNAASISLAPGEHIRWIDRVAALPDYASRFYSWLEANSDINGALADPTKGTKVDESYVYTLDVLKGSVETGANASSDQVQSAIVAVTNDRAQAAMDYAFEVYGAFDRDHPEVFWLSGQSQCGMSLTYSHNKQSGTASYEMSIYFYLRTEDFDIRLEQYQSSAALSAAISKRDSDVWRILKDCPLEEPVSEQVRYLNRVLTQTNAYNSSVASGGTAPETAWKCVSALSGAVGSDGPVCEGYARAFKVLCDRLGIPCVLTEGYSRSENSGKTELHMWNYVQVDGNWYAVDVTWNDPSVTGSEQSAVSGYETETYLLVGSQTLVKSGQTFSATHLMRNCINTDGLQYTNGPELMPEAYVFDNAQTEPDSGTESQAPTRIVQYMSIDPYRGTTNTAPIKAGYVFMGWFEDVSLTTPLPKDAVTGYAYAGFVDAEVLTIKCQLTEGANAQSEQTDLRLLTGIGTLNLQSVVFLTDRDESYTATGLYEQLHADGLTAEALFGQGAAYIATYTIEKIPREQFTVQITVTPGWYTLDGTFVTGAARTLRVSDGL